MGHWNVLLFNYISQKTGILITSTKLREFKFPLLPRYSFVHIPNQDLGSHPLSFPLGFCSCEGCRFLCTVTKSWGMQFYPCPFFCCTPRLIMSTLESFNLQDIRIYTKNMHIVRIFLIFFNVSLFQFLWNLIYASVFCSPNSPYSFQCASIRSVHNIRLSFNCSRGYRVSCRDSKYQSDKSLFPLSII